MDMFVFLSGFGAGLLLGFAFALFFRRRDTSRINTLEQALTQVRQEKIYAEARLAALLDSRNSLTDEFKGIMASLSTEILAQNNRLFLDLAGQTFDRQLAGIESRQQHRLAEIEGLLNPLRDHLRRQEELVRGLEGHNNAVFGSLRAHLEELAKSQRSLERETATLANALRSPGIRGRWGEIGLRRVVELAGLSEHYHFDEQASASDGETRVRPDMVIHLPEGKRIVIDAKTPLNAYLEALEATSDETRQAAFMRHARATHAHMKSLAGRDYWAHFDKSIDFVIMYIEVEPAFSAAMLHKPELFDEALSNRVILATPSTLLAMLQTIAYTWRQHSLTENAQKIWQYARETLQRFAAWSAVFQKTGNQLEAAVRTYNQAVGVWESKVMPSLQRLTSLNPATPDQSPENFGEIDTAVRTLKHYEAPE